MIDNEFYINIIILWKEEVSLFKQKNTMVNVIVSDKEKNNEDIRDEIDDIGQKKQSHQLWSQNQNKQ